MHAAAGPADLHHLRRIECLGWICEVAGLATCWLAPNPVSVTLLALAMMSRFTAGHQVMHGAYDRIPGVPRRHTSRGFGRGWRRLVDWPDWWSIDDWRHTHHRLHHAHTQAPGDTDIMDSCFVMGLPPWQRALALAAMMATWKITVYARRLRRDAGGAGLGQAAACYVLLRFVLPSAAATVLGAPAALSVLGNLILAELLHNAHSFAVIRPSHCAGDIPLFAATHRNRSEFYLHGLLGTVNYSAHGELCSLLLGWQNYQIEHHLYPTATLLQYRLAAAELRLIAHAHGVPYRAEPFQHRFRKMARLFLGLDAQPTLDVASPGWSPSATRH